MRNRKTIPRKWNCALTFQWFPEEYNNGTYSYFMNLFLFTWDIALKIMIQNSVFKVTLNMLCPTKKDYIETLSDFLSRSFPH